MNRLLLCANWKMNEPPQGFDAPDSPYKAESSVDIVVFPPALYVQTCVQHQLVTGGQYGRPEEKGSFTGDISMKQLADIGCRYVLCGHTERRHKHGETDHDVAEQAIAALEAGLHPIVCIGEPMSVREKGETHDFLSAQLQAIPMGCTIAYEPLWAIGASKAAEPQETQEICAFIRSILKDNSARILYGGSIDASNAKGFLEQDDIDGLLIGRASLHIDEFRKIVEIAEAVSH